MIKKILVVLILNLMFFSNTNSEERNLELNKLFNQLKNNSNVSMAFEVEKKIWEIWSIHPSNNRKGYRLTELLAQGSLLIAKQELNKAYEIFSQIILADPNWPEAWNKRATVLYMLGRYQELQRVYSMLQANQDLLKFAEGGQNVSKPMVLFQVICDSSGKCENKVVAPLKWASAKLIHPVPKWSER